MSDGTTEKSAAIIYWSHKAFCAGNTASALIQCTDISPDAIVTAQAYGHIFADDRWTKGGRYSFKLQSSL